MLVNRLPWWLTRDLVKTLNWNLRCDRSFEEASEQRQYVSNVQNIGGKREYNIWLDADETTSPCLPGDLRQLRYHPSGVVYVDCGGGWKSSVRLGPRTQFLFPLVRREEKSISFETITSRIIDKFYLYDHKLRKKNQEKQKQSQSTMMATTTTTTRRFIPF